MIAILSICAPPSRTTFGGLRPYFSQVWNVDVDLVCVSYEYTKLPSDLVQFTFSRFLRTWWSDTPIWIYAVKMSVVQIGNSFFFQSALRSVYLQIRSSSATPFRSSLQVSSVEQSSSSFLVEDVDSVARSSPCVGQRWIASQGPGLTSHVNEVASCQTTSSTSLSIS